MTAKIFSVEDEESLVSLLEYNIKSSGYDFYHAGTAYQGMIDIQKVKPDLILLDWMLPDQPGTEICKFIRSHESLSETPIIMLTAKGEESDLVSGLNIGCDDYLSKPFEPEELFLRINNLLKLYENINKSELLFSFGSFICNTKTNSLTLSDKEIYLTEGENNLLLKLINNRNNTLSREELADRDFDESELRKVDVGITRLRQKIEKIPKQPQYIKTIRGKGYMLICKEI